MGSIYPYSDIWISLNTGIHEQLKSVPSFLNATAFNLELKASREFYLIDIGLLV